MQGKLSLPCVPIEQQAFFFVDPEERDIMARKYEDQTRKLNQRFVQYRTRLQQKIRIEVLEQPLFTLEGRGVLESFTRDPLDEPEQGELLDVCETLACTEQEKQEIIEYFSERPLQLVGYVLDKAFDALACIGNAKEKAHILEWIFAADIMGAVIEEVETEDEEGHMTVSEITRTIFAVDQPFTFQWCCKLFGLRPDVKQEQILQALKRAEQDTLIRESKGEIKAGRHKTFKDALALAKTL